MAAIFQRYKWSPVFWLLLSVLPPGAILPVLAAHLLGYCVGAMGSGVSCDLGVLSSYAENLSLMFELGILLFLISFAWLAFAVCAWIMLAASLIRSAYTLVIEQKN